nr:C-type lectin domain family 4 member A-like [Crassostrea gigas]
METFCYCYNSKPTDSYIFTTLGGVVYYSEEPIAKSIECVDKMYTYLDGVDFCVQVYSDGRNSTDAAEKCQSDGAHLITLDTTKKLHALSTFVLQDTIYQIGLEKTKGSWRWTRNNTLVFDPSLWHASEPNGQHSSPPELCGGFCKCGGKPGIFDVPCNTPYRFICEY